MLFPGSLPIVPVSTGLNGGMTGAFYLVLCLVPGVRHLLLVWLACCPSGGMCGGLLGTPGQLGGKPSLFNLCLRLVLYSVSVLWMLFGVVLRLVYG